jgi:hypothetical protein
MLHHTIRSATPRPRDCDGAFEGGGVSGDAERLFGAEIGDGRLEWAQGSGCVSVPDPAPSQVPLAPRSCCPQAISGPVQQDGPAALWEPWVRTRAICRACVKRPEGEDRGFAVVVTCGALRVIRMRRRVGTVKGCGGDRPPMPLLQTSRPFSMADQDH